MNPSLVFLFRHDMNTPYKLREIGSIIARGDVLIYPSEVREEGGVNVIFNERAYAEACLGATCAADADGLLCLRPIPLEERVFTYEGLRYRVLMPGEVIKSSDLSVYKGAMPAHGELPFFNRCCIDDRIVVQGDGNYYLRLLEEPRAPLPLREAAGGSAAAPRPVAWPIPVRLRGRGRAPRLAGSHRQPHPRRTHLI